ncbi:hypothetical protein [Actinokineospora fastidiosa]|uniref:hypothetical protein n=1 Tax=Actinokineospora fastidiosa TaxID=1816 RepID=UPI0016705BF2|nr:hypothetical protein [Actinokineospora fastidiosa]
MSFEDAPPAPPSNPAAVWAMRIAGLVAVSVISGFLWAYLQSDGGGGGGTDPGAGETGVQSVPDGRFTFTPHADMREPKVDDDCAGNSRGKVKEFFQEHPCVRLTRSLYTSSPAEQEGVVPSGSEEVIYTWVAVVEMNASDQAAELHEIAQSDNTGNVTDPIIAGMVDVPGIDLTYGLGHGGYHSQLIGKYLIIVESDWAPTGDRSKAQDEFLTAVSEDALRYGQQYTSSG